MPFSSTVPPTNLAVASAFARASETARRAAICSGLSAIGEFPPSVIILTPGW